MDQRYHDIVDGHHKLEQVVEVPAVQAPNFMDDLTEEQKRAVCHRRGAACVIAGAGTGKTRTLVKRIVCLVKDLRVEPGRIWVTTFTRKATAALYDRTHERLGDVAQRLQISTIDAVKELGRK